MKHPHTLVKEGAVLIVVDMQDKLLPAINESEIVLDNTIKMIQFAQTLDIPIIVTEQYPKGLGPSNPRVAQLFSDFKPLEKVTFSCFGAEGIEEQLKKYNAKTLIIVGTETHICVQQTALDALARGYKVQLIADAVGSRTPQNKQYGLDKMRSAGAVISAVEIALYELLERSGSKEFKAVLPLIK